MSIETKIPLISKDLKDRWVAALRSGQYRQGQGRLCVGDTYCCLGVLCDISGVGKWIAESTYVVESPAGDKETRTHSAPVAVGLLVDKTGRFASETLMDMNDEFDKSFSEIADYIEANVVPEEDRASINPIMDEDDFE